MPTANVSTSSFLRNSQAIEQKLVTSYTLPPERYRQARNLGRIDFRFRVIDIVYGLLILWLILHLRLAPRYRHWAEGVSPGRVRQAVIFSPLFLLTLAVLNLPPAIYGHWLSRSYGLSIQRWPSWVSDWGKAEMITLSVGTFLIWILYAVIRRSPARWWFYFWLVLLPLLVFLVFLTPLVVDPMFHKFEPLADKEPALAIQLEAMAQHAGQDIPRKRMFWMGAGEKTTELNAYVTGFGGSKRMVVWDTTLAKMDNAQIVYVMGHEMGHYVLHHVVKGLLLAFVFTFFFFYLAYCAFGRLLARKAAAWGIRGPEDWASLPVLLLLLSLFSIPVSPIANAISRHFEHQADQFGLEVTHGLTPDSAQVAAQSFQILGAVDLADPAPNPTDVFWFYSHPPISDRIQFALHYDPWGEGREPEFVH